MRSVRVRVFGIVQGVGFRPTVSRHALACHVTGSVSNMGPYVEIMAQGRPNQVADFLDRVKNRPPRRAVILRMDVTDLEEPLNTGSFKIIESGKRRGDIFVSPDIAICDDCIREMYDPSDRRYLHPFINCTCCGPRLTILDAMPYDRVRTSMADFPLCGPCEEEYHDPESRRYDAQPVCCNDCGPEVYLLRCPPVSAGDGSGREAAGSAAGPAPVRGAEAIRITREIIRDGGIAAIKGIGGFHLCCDACSTEAVEKLRQRKRRSEKPFAVMMKDLATVERECLVPDSARDLLTGHQKPIVLLPVREGSLISPRVAPDNPRLGVMLPYAPIQLLLFDSRDGIRMPDCLVMTSANRSGAPICRDDKDAIDQLSGICDVILSHDRLIRIRADDTVTDLYRGEAYMIRRSRGFAPLPVMTGDEAAPAGRDQVRGTGSLPVMTGDRGAPADKEQERSTGSLPVVAGEKGRAGKDQVLAVGGELKNSFCLAKENLYYISPYIGDATDLRTVRALAESVTRMEELLEVRPALVACDLHPAYNSTAYAGTLGLPVFMVQHHYAHILSCMAENDREGPVIGIALDGTGYGTDHTVWGGEILLADRKGFQRFASIAPFSQTGGDLAAREGWRICAVLLRKAFGKQRALEILKEREICSENEAVVVWAMEDAGVNTVLSTSAGRLFDAVSALLGFRTRSGFEGEASMALQFAAERWLKIRGAAEEESGLMPLTGHAGAGKMFSVADYVSDGEADINKVSRIIEMPAEVDEASRVIEMPAEVDEASRAIEMSAEVGEASRVIRMPTDVLFKKIAEMLMEGEEADRLAWYYHRELAAMIADTCLLARRESGVNTVALSGGCYQNTLLLSLSEDMLEGQGFEVLRHHLVPPNDGGICLGQAYAAMEYLQAGSD